MPSLQRHGEWVEPAALVNVDEIQADGLVADADLTRAGVAHGDVNEFQFFGSTGLVNLDGEGHAKSPETGYLNLCLASCHVSQSLVAPAPRCTRYSGVHDPTPDAWHGHCC